MAKLVMSRHGKRPRGAPRTVPSSSGKRNTVLIATLTERGFFLCCWVCLRLSTKGLLASRLGSSPRGSPARDRASYDDHRIVFSYECVSTVAVQYARARDRRPDSSPCRRVSHLCTSRCRRERHPTRDRMSSITMCRASRCCMCPRASGHDARAEDRRTHGHLSTTEVR